MSASDDDWFNKDLSEFSIAKKSDDVDSQSNAIVVNIRNDRADNHESSIQQVTNSQPMSSAKLRSIAEQTPVIAFLEILHPDSGFFVCVKRKSNSLATILLLTKAFCNGCRVPFDESVKCMCERMVEEQNFWNQCIKYLTDSTYLPPTPSKSRPQNDAAINNGQEIWDIVMELCHSIANHEIRLSKPFLRQAVQLIENDKNNLLVLDQHLNDLKLFLACEHRTSSRNLLPTLDEVKTGFLESRNVTFFNGKYEDVSQYLDIHLALLRVDFLLPVRSAADKIMSKECDPNDPCVYRDVNISMREKEYKAISKQEVKKTVCIVADLESQRRNQNTGPTYYSVKNYDHRLTIGSLLFFTTTDKFNDLIIAKVQSRNSALLKRGYIDIVIVQTYNIAKMFDQSFIMYERPPYFYREIYEILSNFNENTFPLRNHLIDMDTDIGYPAYVPDQKKVIYKYRRRNVDIKNPAPWSSSTTATATFNLDGNQLDALQRSLTQKLVAIVTTSENESVLLASEIVATLFQNTDRQILIVCHSGKNLTKILADIEMYTKDMARIANHNINDQLDQFNLKQIHSNHSSGNVYKLINAYRFVLHSGYREAVNQFTELQTQMKLHGMQDNFMDRYLWIQFQMESFSKRLDEMRQIADFECIKSKRIIGITSFAASKFQALIQLLQSPIVIIVGAHNILEAHTTAVLTTNVEHLILVGQKGKSKWQRNSSTFAVTQIYKTNFSLFDRLLNHNIETGALTQATKKQVVSSRRGPSISEILYSQKDSSAVLGVKTFVFVLQHKHGRSNAIKFESDFTLALSNYLLKQGYSTDDITILAMNSQQVQQIRNDRKIYADCVDKSTKLCKVRVDFIMDFKEKNNEIILLSTTRTKDDDSSKLSQEIQALFARTKLGVFVIGCLPTDKRFKKIEKAIQRVEAIDVEMELICQTHGNVTKVKEATDIDKLQFGGCEKICDQPLSCGHLCKSVCHTPHYSHQECLCSGQCD